jgi:hypothetical protein
VASSRLSVRYRLLVGVRTMTAVVGGYAFTWLFTAALALVLCDVAGMPRASAASAATLLSFLVFAIVVMGVYTARSSARASGWLLIASIPPAVLWLVLRR